MLDEFKKYKKLKNLKKLFFSIIIFILVYTISLFSIEKLLSFNYSNLVIYAINDNLIFFSFIITITINKSLFNMISFFSDIEWVNENIKRNDKDFESSIIYLLKNKIIDEKVIYSNSDKLKFDKDTIDEIKKIYLSIYKIPDKVNENIDKLIYKDFEEYDKKDKLIIGTPSNPIITIPFNIFNTIYFLGMILFIIIFLIGGIVYFVDYLSGNHSLLWLIPIIPFLITLLGFILTYILIPISDYVDKLQDFLVLNSSKDIISKDYIKINNEIYYWNEMIFDNDFENINIKNLKLSIYTIVKKFEKSIIELYDCSLVEFPITFTYKEKKVTINNFKQISYVDFLQGISYYYFYKLKNIKFNKIEEMEEDNQKSNDNLYLNYMKERIKNSKFSFSIEDWELLEDAFQKIYYEVSNADGVFNTSEIKTLTLLMKKYKRIENPLFKELIENITINHYYVFYHISKLDLNTLLKKIDSLLNEKLSRIEIVKFKLHLVIFAYDLAYSSSSFKTGAIVQKEKDILENIIVFLDLNEDDLKLIQEIKKSYPSSYLRTKFPLLFNILSIPFIYIRIIFRYFGNYIKYSNEEQIEFIKNEFKLLKSLNTSNKKYNILNEIEDVIINDINQKKYKTINEFGEGHDKTVGFDKVE